MRPIGAYAWPTSSGMLLRFRKRWTESMKYECPVFALACKCL
jgi:hypothetical protein